MCASSRNCAQVRTRCLQFLEDAHIDHKYGDAYQHCMTSVEFYAEDLITSEKHLITSAKIVLNMLAGLDGKKVMIYAGSALPRYPGQEIFVYADTLIAPYVGGTRGASKPRFTRPMTFSIESMAKTANANGVTLYMLDAADEKGGDLPSAEEGEMHDQQAAFVEYNNTADAFQAVAQLTGGIALTHTANFDLALNTVARDLDSYYSLGY